MFKRFNLRLDYRLALALTPFLITNFCLILHLALSNDTDYFIGVTYSLCSFILSASLFFIYYRIRMIGYLLVFLVFMIFLGLFYWYTGGLFEFTGSDSTMYYAETQNRLHLPIREAVSSFVTNTKYGWDDTGMITYLHVIFNISSSVLFQRIINFLLLLVQVILLRKILFSINIHYRLVQYVMALFATNTAILYFVSSGLKETIFTTLIMVIWYSYYAVKTDVLRFAYLFLGISSLYFFRIPELLITFLAVIINIPRRYRIFIALPILVLTVLVLVSFSDIIYWYYMRDGQDVEVASSNSLIYRISVLCSGFFGPFPSFLTSFNQRDTLLYSMGLSSLMVMRLYTLFAVKFTVKKGRIVYPMVAHIVLHLIVLIVVDRTLKIRYWMPAIPSMFIWFAFVMNKIEKPGKLSGRMIISIMIMVLWVGLWNILRL